MEKYLPWVVLMGHVVTLLVIDFFVLHKKNTTTSVKKAIGETIFFVMNALAFCGVIFWIYQNNMVENASDLSATGAVIKYLTGYIIELSLSVDNLFVIAIIFTSYKIPSQYQHGLLFLGILGAIVFRALLISVGLVLISKIHWMSIVFGLFLLYTAFSMLKKEEEGEVEDAHQTKGVAKFFNISKIIDGNKFRTEVNGKKVFTALFGALITIEFTDLLFALDSIPAIFAVTTDPFIVFSSNIFAIMGLRSLYFFLANMLEKFIYLKYSVFSILVFVALKLMTAGFVEIPEWFSLLFIVLSLAIGVWISILNVNKEERLAKKAAEKEQH
jgi:tellurite resistance protein TerC